MTPPLWDRAGWVATPSAGTGAGAREFAVGLVAAFVDAFQAFRDDCLQLPDLLLLFGFFRIHRIRCCDVNCDLAMTDCVGTWVMVPTS